MVHLEYGGVELTVELDGDGFPTVHVDTGNTFEESAVEVVVCGKVVRPMFVNEED